MVRRRSFGTILIFMAGVGVGCLGLRATIARPVSESEAQRRALQILDQPPRATDIGDNRIVAAVHKIEPTVVNIDTVGRLHAEGDPQATRFVDQEVRGKGSGVILSSDGYVVTNNHVIDGASRIRVTLPNGSWYYAHLIGTDPDTDLAVVRIDATNLPTAELGDSDRLQVGEWSIAVGNPLGLGSTTTLGVISALNRHNLQIEEGHDLEGAIQTDAAINRGNSGGALANINGQLIGINTAILSSGPNGGSIGLGFALPINTVRRVVRDLIADGKSHLPPHRKPWLGIQYGAVPSDTRQAMGLPADQGILIRRVLPDTPAQRAGLQSGDIILTIDGKQIGDERDVVDAILQHNTGERCVLHIRRAGERHDFDVMVIVQDRPDSLPPLP